MPIELYDCEIDYPERLLALADHIETVPPELFNMNLFRAKGKFTLHACGTVGCVLGHSPSVLRKEFGLRIPHETNPMDALWTGNRRPIDFNRLSRSLLGVEPQGALWQYLFSGGWSANDPTPTGAAKRIRWVVAHKGIPSNYYTQIHKAGTTLSYMYEGEAWRDAVV